MADDPVILSERELEVLKLVATGATNQQIARDLVISPNTVKVHLRNIFEKLGVQSRTEATMEAVRRGWVSVPGISGAGADGAPETPAKIASVVIPPLPRWQRIYMGAAAILVLLALLFPFLWRARGRMPNASSLTDVGQPQSGPAPRQQVARWTSGAPLLQSRSRFALVAGPDRLYAIGGEDPNGVTDQLFIYDPVKNTWAAGPSKPTAVANVAGALLGNRVFVPGGTAPNGSATSVLEIYNLQTGQWETGPPPPRPLAAYALAAVDDKLYLFGGWDGENYSADTWIYDSVSEGWLQGTPMPAPRAFCAAAALRDEIYVVGGFDGALALSTVAAYKPQDEGTNAGPWLERAPLSQARAALGVAVVRSTLYAVGGGWTESLAFNEQYDARTGAWARIGTPVLGEWRNLGLTTDGQKLYAVGGWSGGYLTVNEQYLALVRQLLPLGSKGG